MKNVAMEDVMGDSSSVLMVMVLIVEGEVLTIKKRRCILRQQKTQKNEL